MLAAILGLVAAVCYLVAMLGGSLGAADLVVLGHMFVALAVAALGFAPAWPRRRVP